METSLLGSLVSSSRFCKWPSVRFSHDSPVVLSPIFYFHSFFSLLIHVHLILPFTLQMLANLWSVNHHYKHAGDWQLASSANCINLKRCVFDGEGSSLKTERKLSITLYFPPKSPKIDGGAGGDSGTLLTAQTITSESVSTTTTTHITKVKQSRRMYIAYKIFSELFLCSYSLFKFLHTVPWNKHA